MPVLLITALLVAAVGSAFSTGAGVPIFTFGQFVPPNVAEIWRYTSNTGTFSHTKLPASSPCPAAGD
eukprot:gene22614-29757_t